MSEKIGDNIFCSTLFAIFSFVLWSLYKKLITSEKLILGINGPQECVPYMAHACLLYFSLDCWIYLYVL